MNVAVPVDVGVNVLVGVTVGVLVLVSVAVGVLVAVSVCVGVGVLTVAAWKSVIPFGVPKPVGPS